MNPLFELRQLYADYGNKTYGEACSQTTHAISCAMHALNENADNTTVVAALLHDIGHFIADRDQIAGLDQWGHKEHADIAATWLERAGFPTSVYQPIRLHVAAKRYLFTVNKEQTNLSQASDTTLKQQGGAMSEREMLQFEQLPYSQQALQLRKYDDMGKPTFAICEDLTPWLQLVEQVLIEEN